MNRNQAQPFFARTIRAAPDLITAGLCVAVWFVPDRFDDGFLKTMLLVMMIEFLLIHATVMVPIFGLAVPEWLGGIVTAFAAGIVLYILFAVGLSLALDTWWPTLAFVWLLGSRYVLPFVGLGKDVEDDAGQLWLLSTLLWLFFLFVTLLVPIPGLGIDAETRQAFAMGGSGIWLDEPQRLLAFGALYFAGLAAFKLRRRPPAWVGKPRLGRTGVTVAERMAARAAGKKAMAERRRRLAALREKRKTEG